jgi:hypothetical protein
MVMDAICQGCEKKADDGFNNGELVYHYWARNDAYGFYTGLYCDDCYNSDKYPYKKDRYETIEYDGCGEQLESDWEE